MGGPGCLRDSGTVHKGCDTSFQVGQVEESRDGPGRGAQGAVTLTRRLQLGALRAGLSEQHDTGKTSGWRFSPV